MSQAKHNNTSLAGNHNARAYIQFLKATQIPFILTCSNYTTKIVSEVTERKFVHSMQSNRVFAAFSKIKSNLKDKKIPEINKNQLNYFVHDFNKSLYCQSVVNIDLKSAYATVLLNDGYITDDTFVYLHSVPKKERLASVGMLASKKTIFSFDTNGEIYNIEEVVSDRENFFFHAVKRTYEIMSVVRSLIGEGYLFTWVDGIYFRGDVETIQKCSEYLESIGFRYSVDHLTEFDLIYDDRGIRLSFLKEGKKKRFSLPPRTSEFNRVMADAIVSFNSQINFKNEKVHSKIQRKTGGFRSDATGNAEL